MRYPLSRLSLVLLLLLAAVPAFAQTFTGAMRGAVRDANGVIPGVTVELINEATNVAREAVLIIHRCEIRAPQYVRDKI